MRFLLLDRIVSLEIGRKAMGFKTFSPDEEFFQDHFPGYPIVPGVLVLESMAQLGGRLIEATVRARSGVDVLPVLAMVQNARFRQAVRPGDRMDLTTEVVSLLASAARVTGQVVVGDRPVASAEITYVLLTPTELPAEVHVDFERLRTWSRDVWRELKPEDS